MTYFSQIELVDYLLDCLFEDMPQFKAIYRKTNSYSKNRILLRYLMNLRRPAPLKKDFLIAQDSLLQMELEKAGTIGLNSILTTSISKVGIFKGDITRMKIDAIVNPASPTLLGCFVPGHNCVDNDIHSAAGLELREECNYIMEAQKHDELPGGAKLTSAYNLPCKAIIHTVGPSFRVRPTIRETNELKSCYTSCLRLAIDRGFRTICFPAISVGEGGFTSKAAAKIAINTVEEFMNQNTNSPIVIFCLKFEEDYQAYEELLS